MAEKLGLFNSSLITHHSSLIWVHAVSVGEVMAASPLLKEIRSDILSKEIILSTITDTGQKVAREKAPEATKIVYLPFDIPSILNSVVKKARPEILIIIETELWPNMFRVFRGNGIPVVLFNGRISERSFGDTKRFLFYGEKSPFPCEFIRYAERRIC